MFLSAALLMTGGLMAAPKQEQGDTTYLFRFVPGKDMFYIPWNGNGQELSRLETCVEKYKTAILAGEIPLRVDGYSLSQGSRRENLNMAYTRANRVKTELILRKGLTEACFITGNYASEGDFVTVRLTIPAPETAEPDKQAEPETPADTETALSAAPAPAESTETETPAPAVAETASTITKRQKEIPLYLRTNLLRWATLTADLGVEYRPASRLGIMVNGSFANWGWKDKQRRYRLWEIAPEVRGYLGKKGRGFIGALYKAGAFNYKLNDEGKKGDLWGVGLSGGYLLRLNHSLSLDFHAAAGYTRAEYDEYTRQEGVNVRTNKNGKLTKNLWGVNHLGITLVWKPFN